VAYLFLTRGPMPHDALWQRFFEAAGAERHSVYLHATPGFAYTPNTTAAPAFYGREVPSVQVQWGQMSVVDAERRLLAAALADPANERFVLLSESCVPLRAPGYVRDYLLSTNSSFLDSFHDVQHRYNPRMARAPPPAAPVPAGAWRKGTQWFAVTREHARLFVEDEAVYATFAAHCRVDCPPALNGGCRQFCAPDEHYKQTLVALRGREGEIHRRAVTFANWWPTSRAHPKQYVAQEASSALVRDLQARTEHWRPLGGERLRCGAWGGAPRPCWLFARKFTQKSGERMSRFSHDALGF